MSFKLDLENLLEKYRDDPDQDTRLKCLEMSKLLNSNDFFELRIENIIIAAKYERFKTLYSILFKYGSQRIIVFISEKIGYISFPTMIAYEDFVMNVFNDSNCIDFSHWQVTMKNDDQHLTLEYYAQPSYKSLMTVVDQILDTCKKSRITDIIITNDEKNNVCHISSNYISGNDKYISNIANEVLAKLKKRDIEVWKHTREPTAEKLGEADEIEYYLRYINPTVIDIENSKTSLKNKQANPEKYIYTSKIFQKANIDLSSCEIEQGGVLTRWINKTIHNLMPTTELYKKYQEWCGNDKPLCVQQFTKIVKEIGYQKTHGIINGSDINIWKIV